MFLNVLEDTYAHLGLRTTVLAHFCLKVHLQTHCGSFNICTNIALSVRHLGKRLFTLLFSFVLEGCYTAYYAHYSNNIKDISVTGIYLTFIIIKIINSTDNGG